MALSRFAGCKIKVNLMKNLLRTALAALILGGISCAQAADVKNVSVDSARAIVNEHKVFILDVRTAEEHSSAHIHGTDANIPVQVLSDSLGRLDSLKTKAIFVYCRSGHRSAKASSILHENGFVNVTNMLGGMNAWTSAGFPADTGK